MGSMGKRSGRRTRSDGTRGRQRLESPLRLDAEPQSLNTNRPSVAGRALLKGLAQSDRRQLRFLYGSIFGLLALCIAIPLLLSVIGR
jgi:hypothetical protein